MDEDKQLREALAALAHKRWTEWMSWVFEVGVLTNSGELVIPAWSVSRWQRQMRTQYEFLSWEEQQSDRMEADAILKAVKGQSVGKAAEDEG